MKSIRHIFSGLEIIAVVVLSCCTQTQAATTNDLWLEITAFTNDTAALVIHPPWNDTNVSHDLFCAANLSSPTDWHYLVRCVSTNVLVPNLAKPHGFFALGQTNGDLTVTTNVTPQELAQLVVAPEVTISNVTYTGAGVTCGLFMGGNGCGLPIDSGVILSSGDVRLAIGPNTVPDAGTNNETPGDVDLSNIVGGQATYDAAVLEFDIVSSNSFVLRFQYVFASEEYPEYVGQYDDPCAIFVDNINLALVPSTSQPVTVDTVNAAANSQYYVDNWYLPAFNIQYDGMTTLLKAQTQISPDIPHHVKIAVADCGDQNYDSAIFIKAWSSGSSSQDYQRSQANK